MSSSYVWNNDEKTGPQGSPGPTGPIGPTGPSGGGGGGGGPIEQLSPIFSSGTSLAQDSTLELITGVTFSANTCYRLSISSLNVNGPSGSPLALYINGAGQQVGLGVIYPESSGNGFASYSATFRSPVSTPSGSVILYNPAGNPTVTVNYTTNNNLWLLETLLNVT